jgi:5-methylcytosine-specific restriction endonuclease McrA
MARRRVTTSKPAIAEYWLGTDEGRARLPGNAALIDFGEPSCFACGWMAANADLEPRIWQVWKHASLQRCHLVPDSLGGPDAPDNLVLLCARCHAEAPDVGDPDYMLRWIETQESWRQRLAREIGAMLARHEIGMDEVQRFNQLDAAALRDLTASIMRHWTIAVAGRFSYASLAACAIEMVKRGPDAPISLPHHGHPEDQPAPG